MTYVTCPILRYHPAVVAQKAATMQILSGGRFRLGLGAGENLNEHVVGERWPTVGERHEMLERGGRDHRARCSTATARQLPRRALRGRVGEALGPARRARADRHRGVRRASPAARRAHADLMIAIEPKAELGELFDRPAAPASRASARSPICYDPDRDAAVAARPRAVPLVRARLEGQRRPARPRPRSRAPRSSSRPSRWPTRSPAAPTSTEHVEAIKPVRRRRLQRGRARADRRRHAGGLLRVGGAGAAAGAAGVVAAIK